MSEPLTRKTYSLPGRMASQVRNAARRRGEPESAIVREALRRYFEAGADPELPAFVGMASSGARVADRPIREQIADMRIQGRSANSSASRKGDRDH